MGKVEHLTCDLCGKDVTQSYPTDLFGVRIHIEQCTGPVWGGDENVLVQKIELCGNCRSRVTSAMTNAFERVKHECAGNAPLPKATLKPPRRKPRAK